MTTSIYPAIDNFTSKQAEALESLISEKEELVGLVSYQWWKQEVETLLDMDDSDLRDRLATHRDITERVSLVTDMLIRIFAGVNDPIEQLSIYESSYPLGNFLEDEYWED